MCCKVCEHLSVAGVQGTSVPTEPPAGLRKAPAPPWLPVFRGHMPSLMPPRWHHTPPGLASSGGDRSLPSAGCQEQLVLAEVALEFIFVVFSKPEEPALFHVCLQVAGQDNPGVGKHGSGAQGCRPLALWQSTNWTPFVATHTIGAAPAPS